MDVGIQTDSVMVGINGHKTMQDDAGADVTEEEAVTSLPASALASVLKWSKDIATDIHLFSGTRVFSANRPRIHEIIFFSSSTPNGNCYR